MRYRFAVVSVAALAFFAVVAGLNGRAATGREDSKASACDYACLTGVMDQYLKAMIAHDPKQVPVSEHIKFTENTIPLKLGDALWGTMTGLGTYKLYFADTHDGQVGFEGTIRENGTPAILLVRLKVVDGKITEAETVVHRTADAAKAFEKFGQPNPVWVKPLEASQKIPRQEMQKVANSYFDGILHFDGNSVPFDPKCNRILDGYQDTNNPTAKGWFDKDSFRPDAMGVRENMNTHIWSYIHSISPRRYPVIDEKVGIVFGVLMFNHPGNVLSANVPGVGPVPMPPVVTHPSSVEMAEFFKIEGGKIRQIEGISISLPYGAGTGWDTAAR